MFGKKKIKAAALVLSLTMVASAMAGCSSSTPSSSGSTSGSADGAKLSFTYNLEGKYLNWMKDLAIWPEMQKQSNTDITLVNGGDDDDHYYQNIDLKVSSGGLGDAAIARLSQVQVYGAQGAFQDLAPLIDKYAPNIKKYIDSNPEYKSMVTDKDGHIYGITAEYPLITNVTFYREDMFKAAGITSNPTTIADFTKTLETLKTKFGSTQGYYPFTGRDSYLHFAECFGADDYIDDSGKVHGIYDYGIGNGTGYDVHAAGFKDMLTWYNQLYTKGLIDPEWVAGTQTEETWQTKMLTGKGTVGDDFPTRPTWFMNNGGPSNDKNYSIKVMNFFKDTKGNDIKRWNYDATIRTDRYLVIPAASKNAEAVLKFEDFLFSDKGLQLMHYGIEGTTTEKQSDGTYKWLKDFGAEAVKPLGTTNYGMYQDRLTFPFPVDNAAYYDSLDTLTKSYASDYFTKYAKAAKPIVYSADQQKQRSQLLAKYQTEFTAEVLGFVNGKTAINDANWAKFLADMDSDGYTAIHKIDQDAYDAMQK
jgi:putative aldouronate transport system substrate-binding protein